MAAGRREDVLVIGGGVIGLSVAWRLARMGLSVTLIERDRLGGATSSVAAGMLAPVAEVEFGAAGRQALELGRASAELWPAFAAQLEQDTGLETGLRRTGTLLLARDADEAAELERQLAFRRSLGLDVRRLAPSEARTLEPALAPTLRLALHAPEDHAADPRQVLAGLARATALAGVRLLEHSPLALLECDAERLLGVRLADGQRLEAGTVVMATGPWSGEAAGLPEDARLPVRPVKGQILRLRDHAGPGLLERVVRYEGGYLVPRGDGRYVLGATVEERGFELGATAGGVRELLSEAQELLPGLDELEIEELSVGLRPGSPDNLPMIGPGRLQGLIWATGHHRNGILLAPLTAELVAGAIEGGGPPDPLLEHCDPLRFATQDRLPSIPALGQGVTG